MMVSAEQLRIEELRQRYLELLERDDVFPTQSNWQFITENRMAGLALALYNKFLDALTIDDNDREQLHDIAIEEFPVYIKSVDHSEAVDALYSDLTTVREITLKLIRENNLFDADSLRSLIKEGDLATAIALLDVYQPSYTDEDLVSMQKLLDDFDTLPRLGKIENRAGIFGSATKYVCPDGHVNPAGSEYCSHSNCGKNIRGLTADQEARIVAFSKRLMALSALLRKPVGLPSNI